MCLLQVVADDLIQLGGALAQAALEPAREALVEVGPRLLRDAEVRGVADQDVPEAETVLGREDRARRLDELLTGQRHQARSDRTALDAHELADRAAPELLADDGRPLDDGPLVRREPIEPCREQGVDGRWDGQVAGSRSVLPDHGEQLLDEERVALGGLGDPAQQRLVELGLAPEVPEKLLGLQLRERREHDRLAERVPSRVAVEKLWPGAAEDENRGLSRPADDVLDQLDEGRLRPLEVVEADDQGPLTRQVLEEPADRPHRLLRRRRAVADADRRGDLPCYPLRLWFSGQQLVEPAAAQPRGCVTDDVPQWPVGDALAVGQAAADEDGRLVADLGHELVGQPGL